ncbi:uncharacterized protein LOC127472247 [Manacus candei]|uniref:uncharacterized protein LOC127472247 n=1 Tax=Manacus candei TaxID=415023 RepID=UPI0022278A82|nr:uncharacterized protein LOC127472247 [Manacus candei]
MSTNRRKRRGGAVNSRQAPKRSRLLASSAGEASAAEPIDLEDSRVLSFDLAVDEIIDLTDESAEPEVIDLTGDDSVVQWEQNQEHPLVSSAADNSVVLLTSDDEEEPRDNDGTRPVGTVSSPIWIDDYSEWEQNQEHPLVSSAADNSVVLLVNDAEEEPRDNDGSLLSSTRPVGTVSSPIWIDDYSEWEQNQEHPLVSSAADNSVVPLVNDEEEEPRDNDGPSASLTNVPDQDCFLGQWEQDQQHPAGNPLVSSAADSSVVLLTSDAEEEPRDNDSTWLAVTVTSAVWLDDYSEWEQNQEHPLVSSAADNSVVPLVNDDEEEPRDNDGSLLSSTRPVGTVSSPIWIDDYSEWEQNQEHPLVSSAADNSVVPLVNDAEEEPRDNDGPSASLTNVLYQDCFLGQWEQDQQHPAGNPLVSSAADSSVVLLTSDAEEEPRDNDGTRPVGTVSSPIWIDDYSEWEQNQEHPLVSSAADNSVVPLVNDDEEEPRDNDGPSASLTNVLYQDCFLGQWEQDQQHPAGNPLVSSAADSSVVLLTSDAEEEPRDNDGTWPAVTVTSPVRIENSEGNS